MNQLPPLHALRVFESVARLSSFTAAANELCLTQSAISHQIKNLESYFGFPLLEKRNRMPVPTEAGQDLFKTTQMALQLIGSSVSRLRDGHGNQVRLKSRPSIAYLWLMPLLREFYQQHPDIEVSLTTVWEASPSVHWDEYDYVIQYGPLGLAGEGVELLHEEVVVPLCAPELCLNGRLTLEALAQVTPIHPTGDRMGWSLWWKAAGYSPQPAAREQVFDTDYMAIAATLQGVGVTYSDPTLVQPDLAAGRLMIPYPLQVKTGHGFFLISTARTRERTSLNALKEWLFQKMSEAEKGVLHIDRVPG